MNNDVVRLTCDALLFDLDGVAKHRLRHVGLPVPTVMVCGDEVARGKPDPEGYLAAAAKQRLDIEVRLPTKQARSTCTTARTMLVDRKKL